MKCGAVNPEDFGIVCMLMSGHDGNHESTARGGYYIWPDTVAEQIYPAEDRSLSAAEVSAASITIAPGSGHEIKLQPRSAARDWLFPLQVVENEISQIIVVEDRWLKRTGLRVLRSVVRFIKREIQENT